MARSFSSAQARKLIGDHKEIIANFNKIHDQVSFLKKRIESASEGMVVPEVMAILRGVPIEEVNRERGGIRVKALRDAGFNSMADVVAASTYNLAAVKGISEDTAYTIKNIGNHFVDQAKRQVKVRLSVDNKDAKSTELVKALYEYKTMSDIDADAETVRNTYFARIISAIAELEAAQSSLKWLFSGREKKDKAEAAYMLLSQRLEGEYGTEANSIIKRAGQVTKASADTAWKAFSEDSISFFTTLENVAPGVLGNDDTMYGLPEELAREIQDQCFFPDGLLCKLRNYQTWGVKYILHQEKVLLGDEMGLGKTVQAIASMVSMKNTGATHFVVVCPASVITNWCREITKHSLLRVVRVHGAGRMNAFRSWQKNGGVAVTTYETTGYMKMEPEFRYCMLVVDEAHYIKNPEAKRSQNVYELSKHADRLLFMTGTALENKVDEMIVLINMLQPHVARNIQNIAFMSTAPQFREKVAPVYYRRKRTDVLKELPELIESKEWCGLTRIERNIYEQHVLNKEYANVRRVSWNVGDLKESSKAIRLKEIIEEAEAEDRKVIVFSFFLDTIRNIYEFLGSKRCMNPINGSVPPARRQEIIDEFDSAPAGAVLLAQIQSGGTGLNIQSASVVVICEPQFKPSIENQAISRAYRMGQARNVLVYRLLCEDTVDEKITALLEDKQRIFDAFADKSVAANESLKQMANEPEMDETTFGKIIEEEIDRIKRKNE